VKKLVSAVTVVALSALALAALSSARPAAAHYRISATLNAGQEIPKQKVKDQAAHGTFTGTLAGTTLKWKLTFAKTTGPVGAAHIHLGAMGKAGGVAVALCGPCTSGMTGTATVSAGLLATMKKHGTYVNVHTAKNPDGEIRGQIVAKSGM
jgi:hypothetical protein